MKRMKAKSCRLRWLSRRFPPAFAVLVAVAGTMAWYPGLAADPATKVELVELEEAAFRNAARRAAPATVRIWTAGGLERLGKIETGDAPTTGVIVHADGWIVTSLFNLAHRPTGVVVELADGRKLGAKLQAIDHSRRLVLLKADAGALPVPLVIHKTALRTGQWALALGRSWQADEPSIAVGIVSALERIDGKALQTDASISPINYGGPLIDVAGRVMGVLVPLAPGSAGATAGVEWYDSGVGFAIPLSDILDVLPRWQKGDLRGGELPGVEFTSTVPFGSIPTVAKLGQNGVKAGLRVGDRIAAIDGRPVRRFADLRRFLGPKYAGDYVVLTVQRPDGRHTLRVELVPSPGK